MASCGGCLFTRVGCCIQQNKLGLYSIYFALICIIFVEEKGRLGKAGA